MVKTVVIASDKVRVPTPPAGCGYVVTRYGVEKLVVLTPEDFEEMRRASELVASIGKLTPPRRTTAEAAIMRASQDEDFDLSAIAPEDFAD